MAGTKRPTSASGEAKEPAKKRVKKEVEEEKKGSEVTPAWDDTSAVTATTNGDKGMNAAIADQVERLFKYYQSIGDKGRIFGYRNALRAIKSIEEPILSAE